MKKNIKLAVCQLAVVDEKEENIRKAEAMIAEAAGAGCEMAVLPEMFNCPYQSELFPLYAERYEEGTTAQSLARFARKHSITLVGGSIAERGDDGKVYNTSYVFDTQGQCIARHRKIHLFDVDISAGTKFKESDTLSAGDRMTVFNAGGITIGLGICYDIRFVELARSMALAGADMIIYPGAFGPVTGPAHWELLMRSRAIDNQLYVVGASPARTDGAKYQAYGHSMIADPWGNVDMINNDGEKILMKVIDLTLIEKVRAELPIMKHRRPEIY